MGKYRKYRRYKRRVPKKRLKKILLISGAALSLFYILIAIYVSIPIEGKFLGLFVSGTRVVNTTLFKVTYIGPSENRSFLARLQINGISTDFSIPGGEGGKTTILGISKLIKVEKRIVQPKIIILETYTNITYPGPFINTSIIGRAEDFVLSYYPLELHFIFTTQLCNITVRTEPVGASLIETKFIYSDREDGERKEASLYCRENICEGTIGPGCILSYDVAASLTYLNFIKLRYETGKTVLRLIDNPWIPATAFNATIGALFAVYRRSSVKR